MTFGKIEGVDSIVLTFNAPHFMGCMVLITKSAIVALAIMKINSSSAGIFTVTSNLARNLCDSLGGAKGPEIHGSGSKYWWHYHGRSYMNAHCWYVA